MLRKKAKTDSRWSRAKQYSYIHYYAASEVAELYFINYLIDFFHR
jgi:hypothetical protein